MRRTVLKDARRTLQTFTVWIMNFQFPFCVAALNVVRWKKPSWGVLLAALAPTVCCVKTIWSRIPSTAYTCFRLGPPPPAPHTHKRAGGRRGMTASLYLCEFTESMGSCTNTPVCYPSNVMEPVRVRRRMLSRIHHWPATARWLHLKIYWRQSRCQTFMRGQGRNTGAALCLCAGDGYHCDAHLFQGSCEKHDISCSFFFLLH